MSWLRKKTGAKKSRETVPLTESFPATNFCIIRGSRRNGKIYKMHVSNKGRIFMQLRNFFYNSSSIKLRERNRFNRYGTVPVPSVLVYQPNPHRFKIFTRYRVPYQFLLKKSESRTWISGAQWTNSWLQNLKVGFWKKKDDNWLNIADCGGGTLK